MLEISINPVFLDEQSIPEESIFLWAYHIKITNKFGQPIVIKRRNFEAFDAFGQKQVIESNQMVNLEPRIEVDGFFEYASGVLLTAPSGFFSGEYEVLLEDGSSVVQKIPSFSLDSHYDCPKVH